MKGLSLPGIMFFTMNLKKMMLMEERSFMIVKYWTLFRNFAGSMGRIREERSKRR